MNLSCSEGCRSRAGSCRFCSASTFIAVSCFRLYCAGLNTSPSLLPAKRDLSIALAIFACLCVTPGRYPNYIEVGKELHLPVLSPSKQRSTTLRPSLANERLSDGKERQGGSADMILKSFKGPFEILLFDLDLLYYSESLLKNF